MERAMQAKRPKYTGKRIIHNLKMHKMLYILMIPGLVYFIVFKYVPMWGVIIAFQDYNPYEGIWGSAWVGWKHFIRLFTGPNFWQLFRNSLEISLLNIVCTFPAPIILALLMNELRMKFLKKAVQTCVYIPHFLSWVIIASLTYTIFSNSGVVNQFLTSIGAQPQKFLTSTSWFYPVIIGQNVWKGTGWGTIVYLAAISGVDAQLYEAAIIDGAGRFKQVWHITLPAIRSTVVIMLILSMGNVLDTGFEQIFLMSNAMNRSVANVFDTYVYTVGITQGSYSFATAVGLWKSVVGIILIFGSNALAKRAGESGIF